MRGIVLAGGTGSRLAPLTTVVNKHLLPVYDKPMIHYPIATLMLAGVRELLLVVRPRDRKQFEELVGNGSQWGIQIEFAEQENAAGIAEALIIGRKFVGAQPFALILGDNLFHGAHLGESLRDRFSNERATIFSYEVADPTAYACVSIDQRGRPESLVEKPLSPDSNLAVPGLYFFPPDAPEIASRIKPSDRGELEITDVNREFLAQGRLDVIPLPRGTSWMDTGTVDALLDAGNYVRILEQRQGLPIGAPTEIALRSHWI